MAEATREGFLRARPDQRPFLIARSHFLAGARRLRHLDRRRRLELRPSAESYPATSI